MTSDEAVSSIMLRTADPTVQIGGRPTPALTTLLYRVCDNDAGRFAEATRIVELLIREALNDPIMAH